MLQKYKYLIIGAALVLIGVVLLSFSHILKKETPLIAEQNAMTFEIADTPLKQEQGLSGRAVIPDNYGMLFVFAEPDRYGFWMHEMLTSIDILWLADDGTILGLEENVSPDTYPESFYPPEPVRYVLETRAGYAGERGWSVGSVVDLPAI